MMMALRGNELLIKGADNVQYQIIRSWSKMRWDRTQKVLRGPADLELLDKLAEMVRLPPAIEAYREERRRVQDAVDRERMNPDPVPLVEPPVKIQMYRHQIRGFNMALLTLGFVEPGKEGNKA